MKFHVSLFGAILAFSATASFGQTPAAPTNFQIDGGEVVSNPPSGNIPSPGANSTVVWDTRAGGVESFQTLSTFSQMSNLYGALRNSNGASQFFETNVDGKGTNARGCQFAAPNGTEQECYFATEGSLVRAPATGWYTQFKVYLGKSATGSGQGAVDSWTLTGGNPHQKMFIWTRSNGTDRMYLDVIPSMTNLRIDGRNYNSPAFSTNLYGKKGVQIVTVYIRPDNGTVRAWIGDKQVLDATGQNIGSSGLVDIQESVTTFPGAQQVQYMWDTVVWY
jgi:hypothetical protein